MTFSFEHATTDHLSWHGHCFKATIKFSLIGCRFPAHTQRAWPVFDATCSPAPWIEQAHTSFIMMFAESPTVTERQFYVYCWCDSYPAIKTAEWHTHYNDVIIGALASQSISLTIVYSSVYSGAVKKTHQSSAPTAFVRGIHRWALNYPHKWPVRRKMFPFDDVIIVCYYCSDSHTNVIGHHYEFVVHPTPPFIHLIQAYFSDKRFSEM